MDEEAPEAVEPPEVPAPPPSLPRLPPEVSDDADELRRLIDAGASSPEELRALAAKIRDHKALEESLWRSEVKPSLLKAKKKRPELSDLIDRPDEGRSAEAIRVAVLAGVAVLGLLLIATQTSFVLLVVPVVGVLVYAYLQGRKPAGDEPAAEDPLPEDQPD